MSEIYPNLSAASADRDEIIDQLQARIGELLKVNQELCASKNEKEILIKKQNEIFIEKQSLIEKITYLETANQNNEAKIDELTQINKKLQDENANIKKELDEFKNQFEIYKKTSKKSYKELIQQKEAELSLQCEDKEKQINEISSELNEFKAKDQSNSSAIEQLQNNISIITNKYQKCKQKNENLKNKFKELQKQNASLQDILEKMKQSNVNNENQIQILKEQEQKNISTIQMQSNQIDELVKKLSDFQSINPNYKNADELKNDIINIKNAYKQLKSKYQKCSKKLASAVKRLNEQTKAMEGAASDLSDVQDNAAALQKQIDDDEIEIEKLKKRIEKFSFREITGKSILQANAYLTNKISAIEAKINPEIAKPSFRSVIITVISLKRWISIIGLQKLYERDIRIWWWWLVPTESSNVKSECNSNSIDSILNYIDQKNKTEEKQKIEIEDLKSNLNRFSEENQNLQQEINIQKEENQINTNKIEELKEQINELEAQNESKIDKEDFEKVLTKYQAAKTALKQSKEIIRSQDQEIDTLNSQVLNLEQKRKMQHNYLKLSAMTNKNIQKQLSNATDKIGQLEVELDYRDKENLALERHLNRAEIMESRLKCNCMTMAHRNNCFICDDEPDYQKCDCDIKKKLHIMSQNLVTEYC